MSKAMGDVDVVVIGGGPGGYSAAVRAAQLEGKVILIEKDKIGGVCMNRGCIPTAALLKSAMLLSKVDRAKDFGVIVDEVSIDFQSVVKRRNELVEALVGGVERLIKSSGIELVKGMGRIAGPNQVEIIRDDGETESIKTKSIIMATGSKPVKIFVPGVDGEGILTADEASELKTLPKSILIVGGDVIGAQFASIFNQLGVDVTVVERASHILPTEDEEISTLFQEIMKAYYVRVITKASVNEIVDLETGEKLVKISTEAGDEEIQVEKVVLSTGRVPNTEGLGLDKVNIAVNRSGGIVVNNRMETNVSGIYAVGDVLGKSFLTHIASAEGIVAAENAMGKESYMDYKVVPRCVLATPEVASVGLTEKQAIEQGLDVKIGRLPFELNALAHIIGKTDGLVKIVVDAKFGEILGAHIVGPQANELIHQFALAIKLEATVEDVAKMIHAHPTLSEALGEAAWRLYAWWAWM